MYFVGVDLAWGERNPTGLAVLDDDGALVHLGAARGDDDIVAALAGFLGGDVAVAIDAPLVVVNPTGKRPAERALDADYRRFQAGTHPSNTSRPWFRDGTRGARLAARLGVPVDSSAPALEVYPHAATVALFGLDRTLKYKAKQGRTVDTMRAELLRLLGLLEGLADARPALRLADAPPWPAVRDAVAGATRKSDLRRVEDPVDAVLCAYVALYATRRPGDVTRYGDDGTGWIVTPTLPPR